MTVQVKASAVDTYRAEIDRRLSAAMKGSKPADASADGAVHATGSDATGSESAECPASPPPAEPTPQQQVAAKLQEALETAFIHVHSIQAQQSISERMLGLFEEILAEMRQPRK